jgi:hypothetical protein
VRGRLTMTYRSLFSFLAAALVGGALGPATTVAADDAISWASDDSPYDAALNYDSLSDNDALEAAPRYDDALHYDEHVQLAQAAGGNSNSGRTTRSTSRVARTSRVPYMIGDSPTAALHTSGVAFTGVPFSNVDHPIFGGNRINISENGIVAPTDRVFFTYRHFNGAFDSAVLGQPGSTDLEQFTVGFEKTALDGMVSAGLRVPLVRQLNSDLDIYDIGDGVSNLPVSDRSGELGNLGVTLKLALIGLPSAGLTAGVAVNCPTGEDASIRQDLFGPGLTIVQSPLVTTIPDTNITYEGRFENDTVDLVPFIAWYLRPTDRFFHHGFLQIDTPLNQSDATVHVAGEVDASSSFSSALFDVTESGKIDQQTLLRLNLGIGYWLTQNGGGLVDGIAAVFECHYTATLDNANPFVVPVTVLESTDSGIADVPINVLAGPTANNINQVNLSTGLAANLGTFQITNGVIVPITDELNRSFNFEYSLQVNRRF